MFRDDWSRIADHIKTRSADQCVLHFLQLPIEDPFMETLPALATEGAIGSQLPFARSDNPIMSVVAFLAATVSPGVAAAAAQAALRHLTSDIKKAPTAAASADDAMDVDANAASSASAAHALNDLSVRD